MFFKKPASLSIYKDKNFIALIIFCLVTLSPHQKICRGDSFFSKAGGLQPETIDQGYYSGYSEKKFLVIKTPEEWRKVWNIHAGIKLPVPEPPEIDFNRQMIVAVFAGEYSTGGYAIKIDSIEKTETKILVNIAESKPKRDTITTQALTQPYQITQIETTDLPVEFVEK